MALMMSIDPLSRRFGPPHAKAAHDHGMRTHHRLPVGLMLEIATQRGAAAMIGW